MRTHLAVMQEPYLTNVLDGRKLIESRFSIKKVLPFNAVDVDDVIFFKKSSGNVMGEALVKEVEYHEKLTPSKIQILVKKYEKELLLSNDFLEKKMNSNYATLIWLKDVRRITPFHYEKHDQRAWIILDNGFSSTQEKLPV